MHTHQFRRIVFLLLTVALLTMSIAAKPAPSPRHSAARLSVPTDAAGASHLRIIGPAGEDPPVVNERRKLKLRVVNASGSAVRVAQWRTVDPAIGRISKRGALKGVKFGVVTITATTDSGEVAQTTAVVARIRQPGDTAAQGDSKPDTGGNIYLTDPDRQVIYKSSGVVDSLFAGSRGEAGLRDGVGTGARFNIPSGLGIDVRAEGGLYVADTGNNVVRTVSFTGRVRVAAGNAAGLPGTMTTDTTPLDAAAFRNPAGVAALGSNIFVADTGSHAIYFVDFEARVVHLVAGRPGEAGYAEGEGRSALFDTPAGMAINSAGNLLAVADVANDRVRLVRLIPKAGGGFTGVVSTVGVASASRERAPDGGFAFDAPSAVGFDVADNLYVTSAGRAEVVTRSLDAVETRVLLTQTGSLAEPRNLSVRGTEVFVLDRRTQGGSRINIVDVGPPEIASASPDVIRLEGGEEIVIRGRNFPPETRVALGDAEVAGVQVVNSTEIRVNTPLQQSAGARSLTVLTRGGVAQSIVQVRPLGLADVNPGDVVTVAGGAIPYVGDGGSVGDPNAVIDPRDLKMDAAGNMYFADAKAHRIRRIDRFTKVLTTIAGTGRQGYSGDGGLAVTADLSGPTGVAVDAAGNVYISDSGNNRVRRVEASSGVITTVIGTGEPIRLEEPGLGTERPITNPASMAIGEDGAVFINQNSTIEPGIVRYAPATHVATFLCTIPLQGAKTAGRLPPPTPYAAMVAGPDGALFVAVGLHVVRVNVTTGDFTNFAGNGEYEFDGDGRVALDTAVSPSGLAFDANGNLFLSSRNRVRKIDAASSVVTTVGGTGDFGIPEPGDVAIEAPLGGAANLVMDGRGDIVVAVTDQITNRTSLWRIDALAGTVAAEGGSQNGEPFELRATSASFSEAVSLAVDGEILIVADYFGGRVYRADLLGGGLISIAGGGTLTGDGVPLGEASLGPKAVAIRGIDILVADQVDRIFRLDTVAGRLVAIAGSGEPGPSSGDGGPAIEARISPQHLCVDTASNIYLADFAGRSVRRIDGVTGNIATVAGNGMFESSGNGGPAVDAGMSPLSIAIAADGTLFIADDSSGIRRVDPSTGIISSLADRRPSVLAVGESGSLYAGMSGRIVRIDVETGVVTTIAGSGEFGSSGDGGPALEARVGYVLGLAIGPDGTVYFFDSESRAVRAIKAPAAWGGSIER